MAGIAGAQTKTITIGFEGPLSGPQRSNGLDQYRGALLAVEQINRSGGVAGHRIRLIKIDDKADPTIAKSVANAAINPHYGPSMDIPDDIFAKVMGSNIQSTLWLAQMVVQNLICETREQELF
jgi:NAD(P)-dependent dehydrogenase (short-subunit alcohol dehydrogenase family)